MHIIEEGKNRDESAAEFLQEDLPRRQFCEQQQHEGIALLFLRDEAGSERGKEEADAHDLQDDQHLEHVLPGAHRVERIRHRVAQSRCIDPEEKSEEKQCIKDARDVGAAPRGNLGQFLREKRKGERVHTKNVQGSTSNFQLPTKEDTRRALSTLGVERRTLEVFFMPFSLPPVS